LSALSIFDCISEYHIEKEHWIATHKLDLLILGNRELMKKSHYFAEDIMKQVLETYTIHLGKQLIYKPNYLPCLGFFDDIISNEHSSSKRQNNLELSKVEIIRVW